MNAILMTVVQFLDTVVRYSLGAALVALAVIGAVGVVRWLADAALPGASERDVRALRSGSGSIVLAAVLALALVAFGAAAHFAVGR